MVKKHKKHHKGEKEVDDSGDSKPLKLVLKVGGVTPIPSPVSVLDDDMSDKKRKKRKKHRKEKRRRDDADSEGDDSQVRDEDSKLSEEDAGDELYVERGSAKRPRVVTEADYLPGRNLRERKLEEKKGPLYFLLDYFQKNLQKKDGSGIFAFPVTDQMAPRYSEIIQRPMDFSTMRKKIDVFEYTTVAEYREDFRTMLQNCMMYNHPDTIYYKEAQRLLSIGLKQLSKDRVLSLKRSLPSVTDLSESELGNTDEEDYIPFVEYKSQKRGQTKFEAIADHMSAEEMLAQVQSAAADAAHEVASRRPRSKIGFLSRKNDGTSSLNILNPDNDGVVSEKERVVTLGKFTGRLKSGSQALMSFKEDKRNKAIPVSYLTYGSFSAFAPIYDSTTANISKEESDLLISTYADETGIQYSKSVRHFVENCGDYAVKMVDNLLDILTQGQHSKALQFVEQEALKRAEDKAQEDAPEMTTEIKTEAPAELDDVTEAPPRSDDVSSGSSILQAVLQIKSEEADIHVQQELDKTSQLLQVLQQTQRDRLRTRMTPVQPVPLPPSEKEAKLAQEVTDRLTQLTRQVTPADVTHTDAVRKAMGVRVTTEYVSVPSQSEPPTQIANTLEPSTSQSQSQTQESSQLQLEQSQARTDLILDQSQSCVQNSGQSTVVTDTAQAMAVQDTAQSMAVPDLSQLINAGPVQQPPHGGDADETAAAVAGIL